MLSPRIEEYYSYLFRQTYYHFNIEKIYIRLSKQKVISIKDKYLEELIYNYESAVDIHDKRSPLEYYASIEYFTPKDQLNLNIVQTGIEYEFGKYQHSIYLLLKEWKDALDSNRTLKIHDYILENEFHLSSGILIPLYKPKSLFLDGTDHQKYKDLIPPNFVNSQSEFIAKVSKTIIVAWYDALKEKGSIVQAQLTSHDVAKFVNAIFLNLNINQRCFREIKVTRVYEIYKPIFLQKLKEM